jgi:hypothetical protein
MGKHKSFGTHDFSQCLLEGFDASDIVFNYFNNPDAQMPRFLGDYALLARDLKTQYRAKEISLFKASKQLVSAWEDILGVLSLIDPHDKESLDFVVEIFESIPDSD